ncbi:MAG: serine hydrolase, partial [Flavobacteriaceae bacterium]
DSNLFFVDVFDNTSISASTINCGSENECDIEVVKKNEKGAILWRRVIGGSSYDKAGQVIRTKEGDYIVVGSTSSFGKGNYDVFIVKVSSEGEILWQKTYGEFLNEYGLRIAAIENNLYQIEGTRQICATFNVSNDCYEQEWLFRIDGSGIVQ